MRLQGKVKLGFYPTPPPVVEAIARQLTASERYARFRLLDPCAGDGRALALLSTQLTAQHAALHGRYAECRLETYGIELQPLLAQEAEARLGHVLQTSFFTTTLSHGDAGDHGWQCLYLNPPYDYDVNAASGKKKEREELPFLRRATLLLSPGGLLLFLIPQHVLGRPEVARFLSQHYDEHRCVRFPDAPWTPPGSTSEVSMYGQFQQIVFFGRKRPRAIPYHAQDEALQALETRLQQWSTLGHQLEALPLESPPDSAPYAIPNAPPGELRSFLKGSFDPDAVATSVGQLLYSRTKRPRRGVWANQDYWSARFPHPQTAGLSVGHPLHRFKRGYLIVFAVAGLLNHAVLVGKDGRRVLVKGHTRKVIRYSCREDEHEKVEKETECFESSLWCTDLDSGELLLIKTGGEVEVSWEVVYDTMEMKTFLENFGDSIMEQVMALNSPRYTSSRQVPWAAHAFSLLQRKPLGKQMDIILAQVHASVNRWHAEGSDDAERVTRIAEIAEMASGKTYMSICTAFLSDLYACGASELAAPGTKRLSSFPAIVLTPPIMAPKWKRELEQTLPNARVLIVERFGSAHDPDEEDDEDELDTRQTRKGFSDAATAFRQFDPDFTGNSLGTVGSVDRAVACMQAELAQWQREYDRVAQENREIRRGTRQGSLQPLPLKPCHVLILTFNTAKMMPQWMPVYRLKPLRLRDKDSGKLHLLRRRDGTPVLVPCCPSCGRAVKDEQLMRRELAQKGSPYRELAERLQERRQARANRGQELGRQLNICEERLQQLLAEQVDYEELLAERVALQQQVAERNASCDERLEALVAAMPVEQRQKAVLLMQQSDEQDTRHLRQRLDACEHRIETWLTQFARTHEPYAQLLREREALRTRIAHQPHRLATYEEELAEPVSLYLSEAGLQGKKDHRVKRSCSECGEPLWQYVAKKPKTWTPFGVSTFLPVQHEVRSDRGVQRQYTLGTHHVTPLPLPGSDWLPPCVTTTYQRRWAIADYIADQYPHVFHYLIADEVHEGADGTALDQARQVLASACGRMIGLTGTLSNGYASSLFRLFYVIMRQVRQRYPYEGVKQWIRDHGKMQTVQKSKYEEKDTLIGSGSDSKRKITQGLPVDREIAGFDPTGMGLVAQRSTFTELRDVVSNLVGYKEDLCFVTMEEPLASAYQAFERQITAELGALLSQGDKSALSPWYTALLIYPDMPWLGWTCQTNKGKLLGKAPALPEDMVYPLERALIDYVQKQQDQGYPVLVYTENTGTYDDQERLKYLFETKVRGKNGRKLKVAILRTTSTKKTMDREAWLQRCVEGGVDVLICNPALVKVGLDLLHFKRIAYKRTPRKVSDLRQSSRRSLRPGQDTDIEVVFFAYEQSMALRLLSLMARKAYASLVVEGKLPSEGLVSLGFEEEEEEGDLMGRMAREMLAELKQGTLGQAANVAEELQEIVRRSIEIEHTQNLEVGEEDLEARIVLEQIRTEPVHTSATFYETTPPPTTERAAPTDASVEAIPVAPAAEAAPLEVTIVPISVTEDPWASAITVQATQSVWDVLRQQLGQKKRTRRK